jgi:hypothetical protein
VFKAVGVVSDDELMTGYRRFGQRLQGHPTPVLPWVDVATGSLGSTSCRGRQPCLRRTRDFRALAPPRYRCAPKKSIRMGVITSGGAL